MCIRFGVSYLIIPFQLLLKSVVLLRLLPIIGADVSFYVEFGEEEEKQNGMAYHHPGKSNWVIALNEKELNSMNENGNKLDLHAKISCTSMPYKLNVFK